ncbi:ABC transporter ATP-binding protein [Asticcacaulis sp. 201]|uniref:ABC transporter ATP-binding protein n=1 Tax=Asticcacaulis sp. 201 TaxID=3028787 RepID=UPI0029170032|nr:ABC transporter ATP-binding protein [Asticcacaulis sp. 201]MDV6329971.1 ABC transporter ATP-binding protein [Asticcacaulis sp. 201]
MTTTPAIELSDLYCKSGTFALGPINTTVPRGCVLALIGPNGAGKTTLLDLIMGLGRPNRGHIQILGLSQPVDEVAIKARVAYVNPDLNFNVWGTVGRAIDFIRGFYPDWDAERCDRLLKAFELKRTDKIHTLSFGGRIKLSLIMALSRAADILLLDEPTVGLDVNARRILFHEILEIVKNESRTVVISSHQLDDLERLADRCAILIGGQLIAMAPMDGLLDRYRQIDGLIEGRAPTIEGVRVLARQDNRVRLLIDRSLCLDDALTGWNLQVVADIPMTLEDLFVALAAHTPEVAA